jgi:hypothetical protein
MSTNNLNSLIFSNYETYQYFSADLANTTQEVKLTPVNQSDTATVLYVSQEAPLYNNDIKIGTLKKNKFVRNNNSDPIVIQTVLGTVITPNGLLTYNVATPGNSGNVPISLPGQVLNTLATFKSGVYEKYLFVNVRIEIVNSTYSLITISY